MTSSLSLIYSVNAENNIGETNQILQDIISSSDLQSAQFELKKHNVTHQLENMGGPQNGRTGTI